MVVVVFFSSLLPQQAVYLPKEMKIVYYVSGHGFGHATRGLIVCWFVPL